MANGDTALESITLTYRRNGELHRVSLKPRLGDGECFAATGIGSLFFRGRDMDRALGFHKPRVMHRYAEDGSPLPRREGLEAPEPSPFEFEHEVIGSADPSEPGWPIDRYCIHCDGCGWICYTV